MLQVPRKLESDSFKVHNDSDSLFPIASNSNISPRPDLQNLETEEDRSRILKTPPQNSSKFGREEADVDQFDKEIKPRSLFWMSSFIIAAVWLLGLTVILILHLKTEYPTVESYSEEIITGSARAKCASNTDCSAAAPFCDTLYSYKCSECLSSSDCTDSTKPRCDVFGTRNCHGCLMDWHCPGTLICDESNTRTCVECVRNDDCTALGLTTCNLSAHTCS